jgi:TrmH family RNA methyltransferase
MVNEEALQRLSSTKAPQSPVAVVEIPGRPLDPARCLLVAWDIADPGNLGTMIRTAAAFGLDLAVAGQSTDPWAPKVLRAGMGGHFRTAVTDFHDVGALSVKTVAAVSQGGKPPRSLPPGRLALLIGNESHGLPAEVIAGADYRVTIPMSGGSESLNAAAAAAVLAYEVSLRA